MVGRNLDLLVNDVPVDAVGWVLETLACIKKVLQEKFITSILADDPLAFCSTKYQGIIISGSFQPLTVGLVNHELLIVMGMRLL